MQLSGLLLAATAVGLSLACEGDHSCYGESKHDVVLTRHVPRMQPDAQSAKNGPRGPLPWGQINFMHTTDTHGWLEGHIKEENYGADWGDYVSFAKHMKEKARNLGVDLLLIDTGVGHCHARLHDAPDWSMRPRACTVPRRMVQAMLTSTI